MNTLSIKISLIGAILSGIFIFHDLQAQPVIKTQDTIAYSLYVKAKSLANQGQTDSAIFYYKKGHPRFHAIEEWKNAVLCLNKIGLIFRRLNEFDSTDFYNSIALRYVEKHIGKEDRLYGVYLNNVASKYSRVENFDSYIDLMQKVLKVEYSQPKIDSSRVENYHFNLASGYRKRGDYDEAITYYEQIYASKSSRLGINHPSLGKPLNSWAKCYERKLDHEKALSLRKEGLKVYEHASSKYIKPKIVLHHDLAWNYFNLGKPDSCLYHLDISEELRKQTNNYRREVADYIYGEFYLDQGKYSLAETAAKASLVAFIKAYKGIESRTVVGQLYDMIGRIKGAAGQHEEGMLYCLNAVEVLSSMEKSTDFKVLPPLQQIKVNPFAMEFLQNYGRIAKKLWNKTADPQWLELAFQAYQLGGELIPKIRQVLYAEGSRIFFNEKQLPFIEEALTLSQEMQHRSNQPSYAEAAFRFMELSNLSVLYENLNSSKARVHAGIPIAMQETEKTLRKELLFFEQKLGDQRKKAPDSLKIAALENRVFELKQQEKTFQLKLEKEFPAYFALKYNFQLAQLKDLQAHLDDTDELLLQYFWGKDSLYLFAANSETFVFQNLGPMAAINQSLLALHTLLKTRPNSSAQSASQSKSTSFLALAQTLYTHLLSPVESLIQSTPKLVIVADGSLGFIPFEVLINPAANSDQRAYLLRTHAVRYVYSSSLLNTANDQKRLAEQTFLGIGPAYGDESLYKSGVIASSVKPSIRSEFGPLAYNQEEVDLIAGLMKGKSITGTSATEAAFKQHAAQFRILHFAMHAFADDEDPLFSGLVFRSDSNQTDTSQLDINDGILRAYEIYNLSLNADLAVLSACHTGAGKLQRGEGIISLARAFRNAGCPSIVMSLWEADGSPSKTLMESFYRYLSDGYTREEALRQAKLDYLRTAPPSMTAPYFWSNFVVIGQGGALQDEGWPWWVWMLIALGIIGLTSIFFKQVTLKKTLNKAPN